MITQIKSFYSFIQCKHNYWTFVRLCYRRHECNLCEINNPLFSIHLCSVICASPSTHYRFLTWPWMTLATNKQDRLGRQVGCAFQTYIMLIHWCLVYLSLLSAQSDFNIAAGKQVFDEFVRFFFFARVFLPGKVNDWTTMATYIRS